MREFLSADVIANLVQMLRSGVRGALWVCDSDEAGRFFENKCAHPDARVVVAPKASAEVYRIVSSRGLKGVVATTTNAKEQIIGEIIPEPNVTNMLFTSIGIETIISELGGADWLNAIAGMVQEPLNSAIEKLAHRLCEISSKGVISLDEMLADLTTYVRDQNRFPDADAIKSFCVKEGLDTVAIGLIVDEAFTGNDDSVGKHESHGRCGVAIVSSILSGFKPHGISAINPSGIESCWSSLRLTFGMEDFERTEAFWQLQDWQRKSGYPIFRNWRVLDAFGLVWDQRYWEVDLAVIIRYKSLSKNLTMLKLDLDNFKAVNTKLGHSGGDEAIRLYLQITKSILLKYADVYRRGGDEVVVIAPNSNLHTMKEVAETLRSEIEKRFADWSEEKGLISKPTASIGLLFAHDPQNAIDVIDGMDRAQEQAKNEGKNRVVVKIVAA